MTPERATSPRQTHDPRFDFVAKLAGAPRAVGRALDGDPDALTVVYLDVNTDLCNHSCSFCDGFYRSLHAARIPTERLLRLVDEMREVGVRAVVIAGDRGEPLLHPGAGALLERLREASIAIGVYTNGTVLPSRLRDPLGRVAWLRVSVDAATAGTHRAMHGYREGRRDFDRVLRTLATLSPRIPELGVSFVLDSRNVHEIAMAADVLLGAGAHFIEYKPKYLPDYRVDEAWLAARRESIAHGIGLARTKWGHRVVVNNQVDALLAEHSLPTLQRSERPCVTSLLRMVVSTHGCYPCTPFRGESEQRFGDILTQSLREVLDRRAALGFVHQPCGRVCAYDAQNDALLEMRDAGRPLPPPAETRDRFV